MSELLFTIAAFIVALALLIAVHEFGHYWVAKRLGVKVLRFSIGFGKPLLQFVAGPDRTEYVIAGIPLGGYVRMLDEREGEVDEAEAHRAFNRQPVTTRIAIVAAGPLFNLGFAVLAYWGMFLVGVPGLKPILADVKEGTPAYYAGLQQGDRILAVDGQPTPTWNALLNELLPYAIDHQPVTLSVERNYSERQVAYPLDRLVGEFEPETLRNQLGLNPLQPSLEPVIDQVMADSAGEHSGLQSGDRFITLDGRQIDDWAEVVELIRANPGRPLAAEVMRGGSRVELEIRPGRRDEGSEQVGFLGVTVKVVEGQFDELYASLSYGPVDAVPAAIDKTVQMSSMTLKLMWRMVTGDISARHVSGPISIAQYAGASANAGLSQFFGFLAIVSISLGILNLLPIPVLDGGHLFFYSIELLKGSPLSEQAQIIGQKIGISLLLGIMLLAFYNDISRLAS